MPREYTSPKTGKKRKTKPKPAEINPRMLALMNGELDITDLDDEEIRRGQFRSADGTFRGRPVDAVPRKFYNAVVAETIRRANEKFRAEIEPSLNALKEIRDSPRAPADARYKSAVHLLERAVGKVPDKTEMKVEVAKWEENIEELFFDPNQE